MPHACGLGSISTQPLEVLPYLHNPKGPSAHYLRTLGPLWGPNTINKDYLDPYRVRNWNGPVLKATDILGFEAPRIM